MPRRRRNRTPGAPTAENTCFPCDAHHERLLKMAGFDIAKIPTWNVTTVNSDGDEIDVTRMYLFDDVQVKKFEGMNWEICDKLKTSIKGVFAASLGIKPMDVRAGRNAERNLDKLRKEFVSFCSAFVVKKATEVKSELDSATRNLQSATSQYVQAMRNKEHYLKLHNALRADNDMSQKKFLADLDGILKIEKVTGMNVSGTRLEVFTDTLYCLNERTGIEREIGKFKFVFDFDCGDVRFFNRTRKIDGNDNNMNAPHVYESGEACLGSAHQPFTELFGRHDCLGLVSLAIQFIESANLDDIGEYLDSWPESKRSKKAQKSARETIVAKDSKTGKLIVRKKVIEAEDAAADVSDDVKPMPRSNER